MFDAMFLAILVGAGLIVISAITSLVAFRIGAPLLLVFLVIGLLAGEDGPGGLQFSDASAAYFIGSLALAVILFDSGFNTRLKSLRSAAAPALLLATIGVVATAALVGVAAHVLFGLSYLEGFLLGSIIGSTDAAAVFFLLRVGGVTIRDRVRSILEVESSSNDPIAILLTTALVDLLVASKGAAGLSWEFAWQVGEQMGLGLALGAGGGLVMAAGINRLNLEAGLYAVVTIGAALLTFAATGLVGGSGFLAVYIAGLIAGNAPARGMASLRRFMDGLTWLCQIVMFLLLGLFATPSQFPQAVVPGIGIAVVLMFFARPVAVWLCLLPFRLHQQDIAFIGWVGLRGAVSILLALLPIIGGLPNGQTFFNVTFLVVLTSLALQGWTLRPVARRLGVVVPPALGPLEKIQLELPGTARHELAVYHIVPDSPVAKGQRLPRWARPSLIIRDGISMRLHDAGRIQSGDYVCIFAAPRLMPLLDRLFASPVPIPAEDPLFFGQFALDPQQPIGLVARSYDMPLPRDPDMPVGEFIRRRLAGHVEIGDRVGLGGIDLIVREIDGSGLPRVVGLHLGSDDEPRLNWPFFLNWHDLKAAARAWWRTRRTHAKPMEPVSPTPPRTEDSRSV
ncbi:potassium/proton antiporter [Microvirga makkahensis]|uniref:Potassium/proton antiporter n=1 Tax=Microvirga makkahensis TaxID=1128670 RepID=A0A7X3MNY4_9HYPH|nr:potassium/proton antiporter [Microvirga makkahensis]MXQ10529.1 potassium/proton antiporter [Microvirga makkahensis]